MNKEKKNPKGSNVYKTTGVSEHSTPQGSYIKLLDIFYKYIIPLGLAQ